MKGNRHKRFPFTRPMRVEASDKGRERDGWTHTEAKPERDGTVGGRGYVSWGQSQGLLWFISSHHGQIQILCVGERADPQSPIQMSPHGRQYVSGKEQASVLLQSQFRGIHWPKSVSGGGGALKTRALRVSRLTRNEHKKMNETK